MRTTENKKGIPHMRSGDIMDTFKNFIKKTREKLNLTQQGFAEKIGVTKGTVYIWEQGNNMPNISDIELLKELSKISNTSVPEIRRTMVAQANLNDDNDYENVCKNRKYTFLPENIIDFSLNEDEVKLLNFIIEVRKAENEKDGLGLRDYIKISDDVQKNIETYNSLREKFRLIGFNILSRIVQKNNMSSLHIQELKEDDIIDILKKIGISKNLFNLMSKIKNKEQILYCGSNDLRGYALLNYSEVSRYIEEDEIDAEYAKTRVFDDIYWNEAYENYYNYNFPCKIRVFFTRENIIKGPAITGKSYNLEDENYRRNRKGNYQFMCLDSEIKAYFSIYVDSSNEIKKRYNEEKAEYDRKHDEWLQKMKKIRELQELYNDKEKYPDLPEPQPPTACTKYRMITLSKKGEALYKFLKEYYSKEEVTEEKASNYRALFEKYLGKEISVSGLLSEVCDDSLLIRDLYIGDQYASDHLWLYDCKISDCDLKPGQRYNITGIVKKYTKKDGKINLGLAVSNIKEDVL